MPRVLVLVEPLRATSLRAEDFVSGWTAAMMQILTSGLLGMKVLEQKVETAIGLGFRRNGKEDGHSR